MQKKISIAFFLSCLIFALIIFFPTGLYFLNDDLIHIPLSDKGELFQRNFLRPVHDLLLSLDVGLWKKNAAGYHLTALAIHLVCSFCLYLATFSLFARYNILDKDRAKQASLFSAGLFLIYAFHSEAVLWILGGGASLSTSFFLLSVICYLQKERSLGIFIASIIFFQLGLFTYEAIWIAPACIFCFYTFDISLLKKNWKKELPYPAIYIVSFFINLIIRFKIVGVLANEYDLGSKSQVSFSTLFLNFNRLLARSFLPPMESTTLFLSSYGLLILAIAAFLLIFLRKKPGTERFFILSLLCMFLLSFAPYIFLGISTHTRESERYLYLPSSLLCILTGYFIMKAKVSNKAFASICFLLFLYNAAFSYINRINFNLASNISKEVYSLVSDSSKSNETVTVYNLPSLVNGIQTFRSGFKEGLYWLYKTDTSKIKIAQTAKVTCSNEQINFSNSGINLPVKTSVDAVKNLTLEIYADKYFSVEPDSAEVQNN